MRYIKYVLPLVVLFVFFHPVKVQAQSEPVLYCCEKYDSDDGEIGISDRFTTGYVTVMAKSSKALKLKDCSIQYDKYNPDKEKFEYYKKFSFEIERDMKYVYFSKTSSNDMAFDEPGFYRVFLLDEDGKTVASCIVEIIKKKSY